MEFNLQCSRHLKIVFKTFKAHLVSETMSLLPWIIYTDTLSTIPISLVEDILFNRRRAIRSYSALYVLLNKYKDPLLLLRATQKRASAQYVIHDGI